MNDDFLGNWTQGELDLTNQILKLQQRLEQSQRDLQTAVQTLKDIKDLANKTTRPHCESNLFADMLYVLREATKALEQIEHDNNKD